MAKIKVTAGAGRTVPLHSSVATAPGGRLKLLKAPEAIEVEETNLLVQRAMATGDLVRVETVASSPAKTTAAAPAKES